MKTAIKKRLAPKVALVTDPKIEHIAGEGLKNPGALTPAQTQELCGSVLAHISREKAKPKKS